jgi:hypothetical protein
MPDETMKLLSNRDQNPFSKCCMISSEISLYRILLVKIICELDRKRLVQS